MAKEKRRYSLRNRMIGYNLTLMISVVVLCGIIFIASVGLILGSYVQSDINFLLTATADSMESGISYCSDVVTNVRKSELLMDYLVELKDETLSEEEKEELKKELDGERQRAAEELAQAKKEYDEEQAAPAKQEAAQKSAPAEEKRK